MTEEKNNRFWNSFARKYDKFIAKHANETYSQSLMLMKQELSQSSVVLEIGTGTGLISFAIANQVESIKAIDYAPEMIKLANQKLEDSNFDNIQFHVGYATNIEEPDLSFDIIIASNVFHLLEEPHKALKEINRLLKETGKAILPTFCHGQSMKSRIISRVMSIAGFKAANKWSLDQYREFLEGGGMKIEKEEIINDKIPLSFIVASKTQSHGQK